MLLNKAWELLDFGLGIIKLSVSPGIIARRTTFVGSQVMIDCQRVILRERKVHLSLVATQGLTGSVNAEDAATGITDTSMVTLGCFLRPASS